MFCRYHPASGGNHLGKGKSTKDTYETFLTDEKAGVAKHAAPLGAIKLLNITVALKLLGAICSYIAIASLYDS